ncbi:MAG: S41 family peptidase [Armatimonadetes bacterium]|nr:S41 family peptidase [Armatimonadota bacterium]
MKLRTLVPLGFLIIAIPSHLAAGTYSTNKARALTTNDSSEKAQAAINKWREDLAYLARELPSRHVNLFFKVTERKFKQQVEELDREIPQLRYDQILVAFARLVASIGDEHTGIDLLKANVTRLPLGFYWFKDGIFVVAAEEAYKNVLGYRIERIGNADIEMACEEIASLFAHANDFQVKNVAPNLLTVTQCLTGLGLAEVEEMIPIELRSPDGQIVKVHVSPVKELSKVTVVHAHEPGKNVPLYLRKTKLPYWAEYIAASDTVYFYYGMCASLPEKPFEVFRSELERLMNDHPSCRLVIDMRSNGGGNPSILDPFIDWIKANKRFNRKGRLFVILGRRTFSAAILNAMRLRNETKAIFVGEPTGGSPNHYGEVRAFRLPNSKLTVTYSTKYFKHSNKDETTITPSLVIEPTSQDYFSGRDPVMEAVDGYPSL